MATTPKAIKYIVNKRPFAAALTFTGDDTTVDNEWTQLTSTTPGIMTDGTQVVYAQKFDPAVLNSNNVCIFGNVSATFPTSGVTPSDLTPNQVQTGAATLANGANNNVTGIASANLVFIDGPSAGFSITGIAGGVDGSIVTLYNTTSQAMTIANNSGSSSTGNKILTGTGADLVLSGNAAVTIEYKSNSSQWIVTSLSEVPSSGGTVTVPNGGTGTTTLTNHGVLLGQGVSAVVATAAGTAGQPLLSGGAGADPSYGTLGVASGGTGATTLTAHGVVVGNGTSAVAITAAGTAGQVLTSNGAVADPTFQTPPIMVGGSTGTLTAGATKYVPLSGFFTTPTAAIDMTSSTIVPAAGTVSNLFIQADTAPAGADTITFTVYKNGVATAVTCIMTSAVRVASDTTHSFTVAAGDTISLEIIATATAASALAAYSVLLNS